MEPGIGEIAARGAERGPWLIIWRRFARDRAALVAAVALAAIALVSFAGGPLASLALGHKGTDLFPYAVNDSLRPAGLWILPPQARGMVRLRAGDAGLHALVAAGRGTGGL